MRNGGNCFQRPRTRGMKMNSQGLGIGPTGTSISVGSRAAIASRKARPARRRRRAPAGGAEAFGVFDEIGVGEVGSDQPVAELLLLDAPHIAEGAVGEHNRDQRNAWRIAVASSLAV